MKKLTFLLALGMAFLLMLGAFAAEGTTVYVGTGADGTGESAENALGTLKEAVTALDGKGGTIVLVNAVTVHYDLTVPEQSGDLTITAEGSGKLVLTASLSLAKNTNENTVTFDMPLRTGSAGAMLFGGFNSVVFTEDFTVDGKLGFFGGINTPAAPSSNASNPTYKEKENKETVTELPYSITVNGGTFDTFAGGSYRELAEMYIGAIAAPISITVNGGTFGGSVSFGADSALKVEDAFSISGQSILADDATLVINGGTFDLPIYAQGYIGEANSLASGSSQYVNSDKKFYAIDGDIAIALNGGTFGGCEINAFQNTAGLTQLVRGNYTLTIADAAALADGMVLDATQVKAYAGGTEKATLHYTGSANVEIVRFDTVNGEAKTYEEPLRIACIGDSITQGTGTTYTGTYPSTYPKSTAQPAETHSYPAQLLERIYAEGNTDVILGNYGHGGAKVMAYSGLGYHDLFFYTIAKNECDADYYIIGLGINDAKSTSYTYGMCERFTEEYAALIEDFAALPDTDMVYGTTALYAPNVDVAGAAVRAMQKQVLTEKAAAGEKVTFIDLYALTLEDAFVGKLLSSDKLHPHADGYTTYANAIYEALFHGKTAVEGFETDDLWVSASGTESSAGTETDPMSVIGIAFAKAAPGATIHIVGSYTHDKTNDNRWGFQTPMFNDGVTVVGAGDGAELLLNTKHLHIKSDITFDNIAVNTTETGALHIACGYNNVTFTETFSTTDALFAAGVIALDENKASGWYNSRASISSDEDCTINVNGGDFNYFVSGNYLFGGYKPAIYGTYGGDMTINIGPNVTIAGNVVNGACGQNYLTGSVTLNVGAWANGYIVRPFGYIGSVTEEYDVSRNTGSITVNLLEGSGATGAGKLGDLNADGTVNVADVLTMADYVLNGVPTDVTNSFSPYYYGITDVGLTDILHVMKLACR